MTDRTGRVHSPAACFCLTNERSSGSMGQCLRPVMSAPVICAHWEPCSFLFWSLLGTLSLPKSQNFDFDGGTDVKSHSRPWSQ